MIVLSVIGAVAAFGLSAYVYRVLQKRAEQKKASKLYESKKRRKQRAHIPVVLGPNGEPLTEEELLTPSFLRK